MLISHDLAFVAFALLLPKLATDPNLHAQGSPLLQLGESLAIAALVFALEWLLVSRVLNFFGKLRDRQLFNLTVATIVSLTTYVAMNAGLAHGFGVFLGGVLIAKTRYRHQISSISTTISDLALPIFFLSLGLLVKWDIVVHHWPRILLSAVGLIVIKLFAATVSAWFIGLPLRSALRVGLYLSHIGELAFVLAAAGKHLGLLSDTESDVMLTLAVVSLGTGPLLFSPIVKRWVERVPEIGINHFLPNDPVWDLTPDEIADHVVIIGAGRVGLSILADLLKRKIPLLICDQSTQQCDEVKTLGGRPVWGDARNPGVLEALQIRKAKLIVITDGGPDLVIAIKEHLVDDPTPPLIVRVDEISDGDHIRKLHEPAVVLTAQGSVQRDLVEALEKLLAVHYPPVVALPELLSKSA